MKKHIYKYVKVAFVLLFVTMQTLSVFAWDDDTQHKTNELSTTQTVTKDLILNKFKKTETGEPTEDRLPGAVFELYKVVGTVDEKIGNVYTTDLRGQIVVQGLSIGHYYFLEITPPTGFDFDLDDKGQKITRYDFEITDANLQEDELKIINVYNREKYLPLELEKKVVRDDGKPLTKEQAERLYTFTVWFDSDEAFTYKINGNEAGTISSAGKVQLKHGDVLEIVNLPYNTNYKIAEEKVAGIITSSENASGNLTVAKRSVFTNKILSNGSLMLTKIINSDTPDTEKAFAFRITFSEKGTYSYRKGTKDELAKAHDENMDEGLAEELPADESVSATEMAETDSNTEASEQVSQNESSHLIPEESTFENSTDSQTIKAVQNGELQSGDVIYLKHNESIIFDELPATIKYTIEELDYDGYISNQPITNGTVGMDPTEVTVINQPSPTSDKTGSLSIKKEVTSNKEIDANKIYKFKVVFEKPGKYKYKVGETEHVIDSEGIVELKHNEIAEFEAIAANSKYTVEELHELPQDYMAHTDSIHGTIMADYKNQHIFRNEYVWAKIRLSKEVTGNITDKKFEFVVTINGVTQVVELKAGEVKEFEISYGSSYKIIESDYSKEDYIQKDVANSTGVAGIDNISVNQVNEYVGTETTIVSGEKTWDVPAGMEHLIPKQIQLLLYGNDELLRTVIVEPNAEGKWLYTEELPKYDLYGNEYVYRVEETKIDGFIPEIDGLNIRNVYVEETPAVLKDIQIEKSVESEVPVVPTEFFVTIVGHDKAPMPNEVDDKYTTSIVSGSTISIPTITYKQPGVYRYSIYEENTHVKNWKYDGTKHELTVQVERIDNTLSIKNMKLNGQDVQTVYVNFNNIYTKRAPNKPSTPNTKPGDKGSLITTGENDARYLGLFMFIGSIILLIILMIRRRAIRE